jgi:pimeloyl-ACP methyl ester carboxylesterase
MAKRKDEMATHRARSYPKLAWLVPAGKLNSHSQIVRYKGPLLQSHGDRDRTIPYSLGRKLFENAHQPKKLVTIRNGGHNDSATVEYNKELNRFIDTLK